MGGNSGRDYSTYSLRLVLSDFDMQGGTLNNLMLGINTTTSEGGKIDAIINFFAKIKSNAWARVRLYTSGDSYAIYTEYCPIRIDRVDGNYSFYMTGRIPYNVVDNGGNPAADEEYSGWAMFTCGEGVIEPNKNGAMFMAQFKNKIKYGSGGIIVTDIPSDTVTGIMLDIRADSDLSFSIT